MFEKGLRKIAFSLGFKWAADRIRAAAEGRLGPKWKAVYWNLAGAKRWIAAFLGLVAVVSAALGHIEVGAYVGGAAAFLLGVGLLDAGWRDIHPGELFRENPVYKFLAAKSATITVLLATAAAFVDQGYCYGYDCKLLMQILVGLGAALAYLGCADAAWRARPPLVIPARRDDGIPPPPLRRVI